jgi:hypothetical protein
MLDIQRLGAKCCQTGLGVPEEMTAKSVRDEIVKLFYASLDLPLGYFILAT